MRTCRLRELVEWMNEQPFSSAARQPCGTLALDESIVTEIAKVVDEQKRVSTRQTVYKIHVKPHLVYFFSNFSPFSYLFSIQDEICVSVDFQHIFLFLKIKLVSNYHGTNIFKSCFEFKIILLKHKEMKSYVKQRNILFHSFIFVSAL